LTKKGLKRREQIFSAAKELFIEQGFHETSVCQITDKAYISMGNLYYHFSEKLTILKAIVTDLMGDFRKQINKLSAPSLKPEVGFAVDLKLGYAITLEDQRLSRLFLMVRSIPVAHEFSLENERIPLRKFFRGRFSEKGTEIFTIAIQGIADSFFQQRNEENREERTGFLAGSIIS